jgi:hypothetical protein
LERQGRGRLAFGYAAFGGVEHDEPGKELPDLDRRLLQSRKMARELLPDCDARRIDDGPTER